jgi:hypothetical protein
VFFGVSDTALHECSSYRYYRSMAKPTVTKKACLALLILSLAFSPAVMAAQKTAEKVINPNSGIPINPSAPPSLLHKKPQDLYVCQRRFLYNGKTVACDSNLNLDGDGLRGVLAGTPSALEELDKYQSTRRAVQNTAYIATGCLVLAAASFMIGRNMTDANGNITNGGRALRNVGTLVGLAGMGVSIGIGMYMLKSNEARLGKSVQIYNDIHPSNPIELQFSTGLDIW